MWNFQKIDLVKSVLTRKYISFVGSGGKTSLMEFMAGELLKRGRSVAITTTTKIFVKEPYLLLEEGKSVPANRPFIRVGKSIESGKLTAVNFEDIENLGQIYDFVFIEADGAKEKPLKFPSNYEPVIPPFSEKVFVLCGLDGLFGRVDETVFRWELFCKAAGIKGDAMITREVFLRLFTGDALLKGVDREKCAVVLNKYDVLGIKKEATEIGKGVISTGGVKEAIISSILFRAFYGVTRID